MKIYFEKTDGSNMVIITDGETAKVFDAAPSGIYEGIDLYASDAAELLKNLFKKIERESTMPISSSTAMILYPLEGDICSFFLIMYLLV